MKSILFRIFLVLGLAAFAGGLAGCSTTSEPDNQSAIPWNSPKGWEHGLPSGMNPGQPY